PNQWFDEAWYRTTYPDVALSIDLGKFSCAWDHYIQIGRYEGRNPSQNFDEAQYLQNHSEVISFLTDQREFLNCVSGFDYFLKFGINQGHTVSPLPDQILTSTQTFDLSDIESDFDEDAYLWLYPDVAGAVVAGHLSSGLQHWRECGRTEGRIGPGVP